MWSIRRLLDLSANINSIKRSNQKGRHGFCMISCSSFKFGIAVLTASTIVMTDILVTLVVAIIILITCSYTMYCSLLLSFHYSILDNIASYYVVLYDTILCCITLCYKILYYRIILYYTILYYTILYYTILYYTILYYTILYYTILYYTILYYFVLLAS